MLAQTFSLQNLGLQWVELDLKLLVSKWTRRKACLNQLEQMKHSVKFRGCFSLFELLSLNLRGGYDYMNLLENHFWTRFQNRKRCPYLT